MLLLFDDCMLIFLELLKFTFLYDFAFIQDEDFLAVHHSFYAMSYSYCWPFLSDFVESVLD